MMAKQTNIQLRSDVIYSIYVRNHTEEGTFNAVIPDLDRIKALGTDIIWFMPIHPIGAQGKKGTLGCPYANRDYRTVNPEYGTILRDSNQDISPLLKKLYGIKKTVLSCEDYFMGKADDQNDIAILQRDDNRTRKLGIFSLKGKAADVKTDFPDGIYTNHFSGTPVTIQNGTLYCDGTPVILSCEV